jgi:hypothetical protein
MSMICNSFTNNREMLENRHLKVFYSPRRHEGHEEIKLRVLRVFVVRFLTNFYLLLIK